MLTKIKISVWVIVLLVISSAGYTTFIAQQAIKKHSFDAWLHGQLMPAAQPFTQLSLRQLSAPFELLDQFSSLMVTHSTVSPEQFDLWVKSQIQHNPELLTASLALYNVNNSRIQHIYSVGTAAKYKQDQYQIKLLSLLRQAKQHDGIVSKRINDSILLLGKKLSLPSGEWFVLSEVDLELIKLALLQMHPESKLNFSLQVSDTLKSPILNWQFGKLHTPKDEVEQSINTEFLNIDIIAEARATFSPKWQAVEVSNVVASSTIGSIVIVLLLILMHFQQKKLIQSNQQLEEDKTLLSEQLSLAKESIKRNSRFAIINDMAPIAAAEITPAVSQAIKAVSSLEERTINLKNKLTDGKVTKTLVGSYLDNATQLTRASSAQLLIAAEATYTLEQFAADLKQDTIRDINLQLHTAAISGIYKKSNQHKKVKFIENIPSELELVSYSGSLTHILCIVLNNSIEHGFNGKPDGIVMIEAFQNKDKQSIQMRIEDNGNGMDDSTLENIFTTESADSHSGLHLAKQLVNEKLQGNMEVSSKLGRFTRINLTLPIDVNKGLPKAEGKS